MNNMDLSGIWNIGYNNNDYIGSIMLPGTIQDQKYGNKIIEYSTDHWDREYSYCGEIWLQKKIHIPDTWNNKHVELLLERCHWSTSVYIDGEYISTQDSLSVAHIHDLSEKLTPGHHELVICVDNSDKYSIKNGTHHLSYDTQGNWNGIIGDITLNAYENIWIKDISIYTNIHNKTVKAVLSFGNTTGLNHKAPIRIKVKSCNTHTKSEKLFDFIVDIPSNENKKVDVLCDMSENLLLWDEFEPNMYSMIITLNDRDFETAFAAREISIKDKMIYINENKTIFRGSHDACVFPISGTPPMNYEEWIELFTTYKLYGLNHFRAHSWCPPDAAFQAADLLGIYMQVEAPASGALGQGQTEQGSYDTLGGSDGVQRFVEKELERMQKCYGNHPSFMLLSIGNELYINSSYTNRVVADCKKRDNRHLCISGSNNCWSKPRLGKNDDFFVGFMVEGWEGLLRGSYHLSHVGHINNSIPSTITTYKDASDKIDVPVITHEVGQYLAYPDYDELEKYTGVMKPKNMEYFKELMEQNGLAGMDKKFSKASGALQVRLYKEEIEAVLRSGNISGFQLLDIKDFPGQGTALCGILDVFAESKGFIEPEEWCDFCGPVVPLAYIPKLTWNQNEIMELEVKIANYSKNQFENVIPSWSFADKNGKLSKTNIPSGGLFSLGKVKLNLKDIKAPSKNILTITVGDYKNSWEIWIYPAEQKMEDKEDIVVTDKWNLEIERLLQNGGKVLYIGDYSNLMHSEKGAFQNNFWSYRMFKSFDPPGSLGLLCQNEHHIFDEFPTESHSNWQWYEIAKNATPIKYKYIGENITPLVTVIDGYERNEKLGILFEVCVGKGKMIISAFNIIKYIESIVVLQYYNSIIKYMKSLYFTPNTQISARSLDSVLIVQPTKTENIKIDKRTM